MATIESSIDLTIHLSLSEIEAKVLNQFLNKTTREKIVEALGNDRVITSFEDDIDCVDSILEKLRCATSTP